MRIDIALFHSESSLPKSPWENGSRFFVRISKEGRYVCSAML